MKPIEEWTEQDLLSLPTDEDYRFDRKSSKALVEYAAGSGGGKPRLDMSCDVSAFANSRGGYLIYGIDDDGKIDGGVPIDLKGGTIEWLDNVIPELLQPRLRGHKLRRIEPIGKSEINVGHAVIVVEAPDSPDAPHQALDKKYYIRNNTKKEPADHWVIEDIRNRITRKAKLEVLKNSAKMEGKSFYANLEIRNSGLASSGKYHWELLFPHEFSVNRPTVVLFDANNIPMQTPVQAKLTPDAAFWHFGGLSDVTVFPNRQVPFVRIAANNVSNLTLRWRIAAADGDFPGNGEYGILDLP